jgi:hypothetical protein
MEKLRQHFGLALATAAFLVCFLAVPIHQLAGFTQMPGDLGDARLNNYFLENIYLYFAGRSPSLVHLSFFAPFPYVLGFSDNLFGAAPIYLLARYISGESDTAFQIWYVASFPLNFMAAYYALRNMQAKSLGATFGALIFTFAFPVQSQMGHAQLSYRFAVPLATLALLRFLETKDHKYFLHASVWAVWQFYCSIYMGTFLAMFLAVLLGAYLVILAIQDRGNAWTNIFDYVPQLSDFRNSQGKLRLAIFSGLLVLLALLFYPYFEVSHLYNATRGYDEIATMLPRLQSYFFANISQVWEIISQWLPPVPMQHEHQMFIGSIGTCLAAFGCLIVSKRNYPSAGKSLAVALCLIALITMSIGGFSLWYLFSKLPLLSAIRAVTRIILVMLFPLGYLSSVAVDRINQGRAGYRVLSVTLLAALICEFVYVFDWTTPRSEWRQHIADLNRELPTSLPQDAIVFLSQKYQPYYIPELDAMLVAQARGVKTLNGYSSFMPAGFHPEFGENCAEAASRVGSFVEFSKSKDPAATFAEVAKRIVPIGFSNCAPNWQTSYTPCSVAAVPYDAETLKRLSLSFLRKEQRTSGTFADLKLANANSNPISCRSKVDKPVRISWRYLDENANPLSDWNAYRLDLPTDIPAQGSIIASIPFDHSDPRAAKVEVSFLEEHVAWAHDLGIKPLQIDIR